MFPETHTLLSAMQASVYHAAEAYYRLKEPPEDVGGNGLSAALGED